MNPDDGMNVSNHLTKQDLGNHSDANLTSPLKTGHIANTRLSTESQTQMDLSQSATPKGRNTRSKRHILVVDGENRGYKKVKISLSEAVDLEP